MTKHTSGPWKSVRVKDQNKIIVRTVKPRRVLIELPLHSVKADNKTNLADARLIAASPELLEALKRAYQQCIEFLNEGGFRRKLEWDAGYIVDAIAKAEGRDP